MTEESSRRLTVAAVRWTAGGSLGHDHELLPAAVRAGFGVGHEGQVFAARIMERVVAVDEAAAEAGGAPYLDPGCAEGRKAAGVVGERGRVEIVIEVGR